MIDSTTIERLRGIGLTNAILQQFDNQSGGAGERRADTEILAPMRVVEVQRERLTLHDGTDEHAARTLPALRAALAVDVPAVAVDAQCGEPGQALRDWLQCGQTLVLLGSSGAGKSTLTNALVGQVAQLTGANRTGDSRGRHTTSARSLHRSAQGACIIDTPGLRTLRLDGDASELGAAFDDIAHYAQRCRFRDCSHADEPGCAVRVNVSPDRLHNYGKLLREAQRDTQTAMQRKAQVQQWKARGREARLRAEAKRG